MGYKSFQVTKYKVHIYCFFDRDDPFLFFRPAGKTWVAGRTRAKVKMDLSFPDSEVQVLVKYAKDSKNVGLWKTSQGDRIYRTRSFSDLASFVKITRGLKRLDFDLSVLAKIGWPVRSLIKIPFRVRVPDRTLSAMLPPWMSPLKNKLPKKEEVYPKGKTVYPPIEQVFSGLWFDPKKLKVLIIGQDPYHGPGQAHGLAFSYRGEGRIPPSLVNIYSEVNRIDPEGFAMPSTGDLTPWFHQGVALVNASLSVLRGQAGSLAKEWHKFSEEVFKLLAKETTSDLVVLAWGKHAQKVAESFTKAKVLKSSHPSPYSVTSPPTPFSGNGHFRMVNDHLRSRGLTPIDWRL